MELAVKEGIKIITEFMGINYTINERGYVILCDSEYDPPFEYPKYHTSWDWFMDACKKFRNCPYINIPLFNATKAELIAHIQRAINDFDINLAFKRLVIAIQWYNQQKQTP